MIVFYSFSFFFSPYKHDFAFVDMKLLFVNLSFVNANVTGSVGFSGILHISIMIFILHIHR